MFALETVGSGTIPATTIDLSPFVVAVLGGTVIPILTALATKLCAGSHVKAIFALVLSVIVGALSSIVTADGHFNVHTLLLTTGVAFATQITSYLGVYKPTQITDKIATAVPGGIGTDPTQPPGG